MEICYYEEIEIEDMDYDADTNGYYYPCPCGDRFIIILQSIKKKAVWNITLLTHEFKVYNLKVDASNGETLEETEESIMNFKKEEIKGDKN